VPQQIFFLADVRKANFIGCNLTATDFEHAAIDRATFEDADLQNTNFERCSFYSGTLERYHFSKKPI